jgi:hypothetical protein
MKNWLTSIYAKNKKGYHVYIFNKKISAVAKIANWVLGNSGSYIWFGN